MAWTYRISTGELANAAGEILGEGYSGAPGYVNDVSAVALADRGPIPPGNYLIGAVIAHDPKLGAYVMPLQPDPTNMMHNRSDFYLHGDNVAEDHSASEGCIVAPHDLRVAIATSGDSFLTVIV